MRGRLRAYTAAMVLGTCRFELLLDDNASLKGKRSVVVPVVAHLRRRFHVAAAEVDAMDDHTRAIIGFAVVANEVAHASRMVESVMAWVDTEAEAPLGHYEVEYLHVF